MATEQAEIASRHAVYLERYKSHEIKQYEPFLQRIAKLIRVKLSGELIADEWTRIDLEKQLRSINKDIKLIQGEYTDELIKSSLTLADYEAGYEARSMSQMIDYDFELPSETQLKSAVFTNPLTVEGAEGGKLLTPFFKDMPNKSIDAVTNHIRAGYYEGLTTPQIIKNILGTKNLNYSNGKLSDLYRSTELVTRTGLQHTAAQASMETYKRNEDLIKGYEWLATLDYKTSSLCRSLDGRVFPKGEPHPTPPAHLNACLKGTLILTSKGNVPIEDVCVGDYVKTHTGKYKKVYIVMARDHNGNAIELKNNFGGSVSLTSEHPILTEQKGWVEAGDIKIGDKFFNNVKQFDWSNIFRMASFVPQSVLLNAHNIITSTTQELVSYGIFSYTPGMSSAVKLNNSVPDNKVRVVSKYSVLSNIFNVNTIKDRGKKFFMRGKVVFKYHSKRISAFFESIRIKRWVVNFHSIRALFGNFSRNNSILFRPMFITSFSSYMNLVVLDRLIPAFQNYPMVVAKLPNAVIRKTILSLNHSNAFIKPVMMHFNNFFNFFQTKHNKPSWLLSICTSIVAHKYKGMVYNLAVEEDETYIANGFVVHNCRSKLLPTFKPFYDVLKKGATRPARDPKTGKVTSVPAKTSYFDWLKQQPPAFQDDQIGKTRGKLLREGGLTSRQFADLQLHKNFTPMTIKEMRAKEALAFERAKI